MSIIDNEIFAIRDDSQVENLSRFFKTGVGQYGEGDVFLGVKVPKNREAVKRIWKDCTLKDVSESITSKYHEVRLASLLILIQIFRHAKNNQELRGRCVNLYLSNTKYINNWDLVDLSCYEILGVWLFDGDRALLYDLALNGKSIWEQRIAIVSCTFFVRHNRFDDCLAIADILLRHKHDLIQKAVGWLLREVGKRDEAELVNFLSTRYREMPRTMLRYAVEKFPEEIRQAYLKGLKVGSINCFANCNTDVYVII